jgi:hypothetical protein
MTSSTTLVLLDRKVDVKFLVKLEKNSHRKLQPVTSNLQEVCNAAGAGLEGQTIF